MVKQIVCMMLMAVSTAAFDFNPITLWKSLPRTRQEAHENHALMHLKQKPMHPSELAHLQTRAHQASLRVRARRIKAG